MLAKVEYGGIQKYIKVPQTDETFDFFPVYSRFVSCIF